MLGLKVFININDMTIQSLADELGVSRQIVSKWCNKEKQIPVNRLNEISNILSVPTHLLIKEITSENLKQIKQSLIKILE